MDLVANKKVSGWESRLYNLSDIFWVRDEAAILDVKFTKALTKSLDENGMKFPVLITNSNMPITPYKCLIGNNRLHWAFNKNYKRVECIYLSSKEDEKKVLKLTEMEYGRDF
jgi:hypothetical protein